MAFCPPRAGCDSHGSRRGRVPGSGPQGSSPAPHGGVAEQVGIRVDGVRVPDDGGGRALSRVVQPLSTERASAHPGPPAGSGVWAVVAWLVPVVNLWVPRRLVLDVQRASSTGATEAERDEVLMNAWWVTWVGHAVITVGSQGGRGTSILLLVVSQAFNLAAAVLAICVVQRITALQSAALHANPPFEPLTHA